MAAKPSSARTLLAPEELEKALIEAGARSPSALAQTLIAAITDQAEHDQAIILSSAREAYREGFLLGRLTPRFVPFSFQMWRASKIFQRLSSQEAQPAQSRSRFANRDNW